MQPMARPARPLTALVFMEQNGYLLYCATLKEFKAGDEWTLIEEHPEPPTDYALLAKWTDPKWGEECIHIFESDAVAEEYAATHDVGRWQLQLVRIMGGCNE
jgi:hypothetical protein